MGNLASFGSFTSFQDLNTFTLGKAGGEILQSRSGHLDVADAASLAMHVEIFSLDDGGHLYLETAVAEEGPWMPLAQWSHAVDDSTPPVPIVQDETIQLSTYYSATYRLLRFVRWRFTYEFSVDDPYAEPVPGAVSFRMRYQMTAPA